MRIRLKVLILSLLLSIGCASVQKSMYNITEVRPSEFNKNQNEGLFTDSYERVWNAVVDLCSEYPIININEKSSLIVTDWRNEPPPFIFILNEGQREQVIFKSDVGGAYTQKRERLNIRVKKESNGIRVIILTSVEVYLDNYTAAISFNIPRIQEWKRASSDGITENKILKAIEKKLAAEEKNDNNSNYCENGKSKNDESILNELLSQDDSNLLDIAATAQGKYLLIYQTHDSALKLNEFYDIIRINGEDKIKIGSAKVIQIKENKAALQYQLVENNVLSTKNDKIRCK